jgi:hypothetical protein
MTEEAGEIDEAKWRKGGDRRRLEDEDGRGRGRGDEGDVYISALRHICGVLLS